MSRRRLAVAVGAVPVVLAVGGCTGGPTPAPVATPTPGSTASTDRPTAVTSSPTPSAAPTITEPTTTNTLPAPPKPSRPAASTAGSLTAAALPIPAGWHKVVKKGGEEEGFEGNGTWVHARDPRYAATDTITVGCAEVTRDDFSDPVDALEGDYADPAGRVGVGLVLRFRSDAAATGYLALYRKQVAACTDPDGPVVARILTPPSSADALVDTRAYPGPDRWTEVVERNGSRVTLIILNRTIDAGRAEAILNQIS